MTNTQHTVLARMSDGEWYLGATLHSCGSVLSALSKRGYIRCAGDGAGFLDDNWTITTEGLAALEAAG